MTEKETFAWFIRGKKIIEALTIPVTRQALTAQINQYQQFFAGICSAADLSRFDPQAGKKLYALLLKDFAPLLQEGERLVIVPDEIIGILPFEALVMELPAKVEIATGQHGPYPKGVKYLGDVYPISYSQSATALTLARTLRQAGAGKKEKMLVVADPGL